MELKASIVSIGGWNSRIFTPQWVSANVFNAKNGESIEIQLDEQQLMLSYKRNDIQFATTDVGVEFSTKNATIENCRIIESYYRNLISILPFTPVRAFGYNYNVVLTKDEFEQTKLAKIVSYASFGMYHTSSQSYSENVENGVKNIIVNFVKDKVEVVYNYHITDCGVLPIDDLFVIIKKELDNILYD